MIRKLSKAALASGALLAWTAADAQTGDLQRMAGLFGAREEVAQASLSPDGSKIAFVRSSGARGASLFIADLTIAGEVKPREILRGDGNPERLHWCRWSSNTRLLCYFNAITDLGGLDIAYASRLVGLDADGRNMELLENKRGTGNSLGFALFGGEVIDWSPGTDGHVLMIRQYIPESTTGTRLAQTKDGFSVDDVDTATLRSKIVEQPDVDAREYISDGRGVVRILGRRRKDSFNYDLEGTRYLFRRKDSRKWEELSLTNGEDASFDPHGVDPDLDIAYGLKDMDGRRAAFSKALDGTGTEKLVFAHPQVDVDGFVRIGRNGRIVGVTFATDKREVVYFDPKLAKLAKALSTALPKLPMIRFIDSSQDESVLLLWAGSDVDPGHYYLLNRKTNGMEEIALDRPDIDPAKLAQMKHISYPAADGTMIPAYLSVPPTGAAKGLPAIVMPHGGPGARDEWGFDWLSQFFVSQGYAVLQPNFRGSAGYGDGWFQKNGFQSWRTAIGDVGDAGRWLVSQGIADPSKLAIFGWSYGGYAALQSAATTPDLFKAVIAVAPVTDLDRLREEWRIWSNYELRSAFIGTGPHVAEGSPARHADAIKAPVLMFHGTVDRNVGVGQSRLMDSRLKEAGKSSTLVTYDNLDHYLDDSAARTDMLTKSAEFLNQTLKR